MIHNTYRRRAIPGTDEWCAVDDLRQVEPFKALPRQHLSSLAVFMRSATYERGAVIVRQDEAAEQLFVIMQGEARVLGKYDAGEDLTTLASAPKRRLSDRAAERVRGDEDSATPSAAQVRAMNPHEMRGAVRLDGVRPGRRAPGELVARWGGVGGLNGAGIVVHGGAEVSGLQRMAPLAVIGEGQAFGEEVLGLTTAAVRCNEDGEEFLVRPQNCFLLICVCNYHVRRNILNAHIVFVRLHNNN
jgi:CRP-like cAMP-binding protein